MAIMTNLIILILVEVQGNYLIPTSFHSSSFPIFVCFPSKLDNVQELFYYCLESNIKRYSSTIKKKKKKMSVMQYVLLEFTEAAFLNTWRLENTADDPVYKKAFEVYE